VLSQRSLLFSYQGDYPRAIALARQALTLLPESDYLWRSHCLGFLGIEAFLTGQLVQARKFLLQSLTCYESSRDLAGIVAATALLGEVCFGQGELHQAASYYHQALSSLEQRQELVPFPLSLETEAREIFSQQRAFYEQPAFYGLAAILYEQNQLAEAEQYLHKALSQGPFAWLHILIPGLMLQVRLQATRGEERQAQQDLNALAAQMQQPEVLREIHLCQAWLALHMEDLATVEQWATSYEREAEPLSLIRREEEALLLARLQIARHQPQAALDVLAPWKQASRAQQRKHSELQIMVLEALAHETRSAHEQAMQILLEVLTRARPEGYQRLFLAEGEAMKTLLRALTPDLQEQALASYVRSLLQAFSTDPTKSETPPSTSASPLLEPLTPQEYRVLRLLAEGASNQQIANQLVISLATVRKHVSNILGKLGVSNRTQAVARAQAYALL
ncbi:MAG TPA: LuxR C-terminal-related transcriptional regulator, partial [Ktedonobacteraceae bacterium]|nr:LuxR C-terminal-related transcriptional regulator [Ktedonobacteraceae bacterium]